MRKQVIKIASLAISIVLMIVGLMTYSLANTVQVSNEAELRAAIANRETSITLSSSFSVSQTIEIGGSDAYQLRINGGNNTLSLSSNTLSMFKISGSDKNITFDGVNFDGVQQGRFAHISGATVEFLNGTYENGVSYNENATAEDKATANSDGGVIYAVNNANVKLSNITARNNLGITPSPPKPRDDMNGHGGVIYAFQINNLTIENSTLENNVSGTFSGGGAVYIESSNTFNVTGSTMSGNHNNAIVSASNQGGAFYIHSTKYIGEGNTFNIGRTFNTGGAIYVRSAHGEKKASETNSSFNIGALGDGFGISGGAIMLEGGDLTVEASNFKSTDPSSKVTHAGGFIGVAPNKSQVADRLTVRNSNFTGNGSWWNGPGTATYGGAIAFETDKETDIVTSNAIALIENSSFRNIAADENGGAITINTKPGYKGNVNLTIRNSTIDNTRTRFAWKNTIGGGIYNGEGNTVTIEGGNLVNSFAVNGGSIYNEAHLTITGGAKLNNNTSYRVGGGIYNNGYLKVDNATLTNNRSAENKIYPGSNTNNTKNEMIGGNIYAKKDVIITPYATFDRNDVRVLDQESAILLTGTLGKQINVSISENEYLSGDFHTENQHRYLGYTVAKGTEGYTAVPTDAQKLHYITRDTSQPSASYEDHTSTGTWDYVFNPDKNTVVLGQRAKMVYHTNEANATIEGGVVDTDPAGQKLSQLYTVYGVDGNSLLVSIDDVKSTDLTVSDKVPVLDEHAFKGWGTAEDKEKPKYYADKSYHAYNFEKNNFASNWLRSSEVTEILSPNANLELANTLNTYAVYDKMLIVKAKKEWNADNKGDITLQLVRTDKNNEVIEEKLVAANNSDWITFKAVPNIDENGADISSKYSVIEKDETSAKVNIGGRKYSVAYSDITEKMKADGSAENNTKYFTVKNSELFNIDVVKVWNDEEVPENPGNPDKGDDSGETGGDHSITTADKSAAPSGTRGMTVGNGTTVTPPPTPNSVRVALYRNDVQVGEAITLSKDNGFVGMFTDVALTDGNGKNISDEYYLVEVGEKDGVIEIDGNKYSVTVSGNPSTGFAVRNTYMPPKIPLQPAKTILKVVKTWGDAQNKEEAVVVELFKNGVATGNTAVLNEEGNWEHTFRNLPVSEDINSPRNVYTVKEKDGQGNYLSNGGVISINGKQYKVVISDAVDAVVTITNTYMPPMIPLTPAKTKVKVQKQWSDENNKASSVSVVLVKNGVETDEVAVLNEENQWTHTFENLNVVDNIEDAQGVAYTVKEVGEANGKIDIEGKNYSVIITGNAKEGFVIENRYNPPMIPLVPASTKIAVEKKWSDEAHKADSVEVELLKNGVATGNILVLSKEDGYKGVFENLPVVDKITDKDPIVYTIREVGETDGKVKLGEYEYKVSIEGSAKDGFVITNTYVAPKIPDSPKEPNKPKAPEPSKEKEVKSSKAPDTGDNSNMALIVGILLLSILTIIVLLRKKDK